MVDCSHANSEKDPSRQPAVAREVVRQIAEGNQSIMGLMLESHLEAGNQSIPEDPPALRYGVSVTDGCIDWDTTETLLIELATALAKRKKSRAPIGRKPFSSRPDCDRCGQCCHERRPVAESVPTGFFQHPL